MLVSYKKKNMLTMTTPTYKQLKLVPGMNEVENSVWEEVEKHPSIVKLINMGDLIVKNYKKVEKNEADNVKSGDASGDTNPDVAPTELDSLNQRDAIEVIKDTLDLDYLEKALQSEKRKGVKSAIEAQIKHIEEVTKPEQTDSE